VSLIVRTEGWPADFSQIQGGRRKHTVAMGRRPTQKMRKRRGRTDGSQQLGPPLVRPSTIHLNSCTHVARQSQLAQHGPGEQFRLIAFFQAVDSNESPLGATCGYATNVCRKASAGRRGLAPSSSWTYPNLLAMQIGTSPISRAVTARNSPERMRQSASYGYLQTFTKQDFAVGTFPFAAGVSKHCR
jgi:hypothetical protein